MDSGARLAIEAIVMGLIRSGAIGNHALTVIVDELRMAARASRDQLYDYEARCIEELAVDIGHHAKTPLDGAIQPNPLGTLSALVRSVQTPSSRS